MSKHASKPTERRDENSSQSSGPSLRDQYEIIRNDIMKLRDDLNKGYDMAKSMVDRKTILNQLLKVRS